MERGGPSSIPQIPARPTIFEYAESLSFFHGRLTTTEEDRIFKYYLDTRGAYLLRKSNRQQDTLVISIVVDRKNIFHIQVEQRHGKVCILQSNEVFPTLAHLIEYFHIHPFPATRHKELYLTKAISANKFSPTPSGTPPLIRRAPDPTIPRGGRAPDATAPPVGGRAPGPTTPVGRRAPAAIPPVHVEGRAPPLSSEQRTPSIEGRPQMPLPLPPSQNPIYAEYRHLYSRVDKVEPDQLNLILELCEVVDKEIQSLSRMKCSCGLYMEESELIDGWMMHRDTEGEATRGRIFFLDTKTKQSTWKLPKDLELEIQTNYPEKWKLLNRLTKEPLADYDF